MTRRIGFFPIMVASFAVTVALTLPARGRSEAPWPSAIKAKTPAPEAGRTRA